MQISAFQQAFPLSRKKFWKKFISQTPIAFFLLVISLIILGVFVQANQMFEADLRSLLAFMIIGVMAVILLAMAGYAIYLRVYIRRYYYDSNDQFITVKKGVFTPAEIHVQYFKIQDVYVDQDLLDRIFGIYDVHLSSATYASGIEAHIDGVDPAVAEGLKNNILGRINGVSAVSAPVAPAAPTASAISYESAEEISTKTFPISGKYFVTVIWSGIILSAIASLGITVFFRGSSSAGLPVDAQLKSQINVLFQMIGGRFIFLAIIFFTLYMVWQVLWIKKYYFAFGKDFILQRTGVISTQERHLPYRSVQDVQLKQFFIDKIFSIANVTIENAAGITMVGSGRKSRTVSTGGILIPGLPIEKARELVEKLNAILSQQKNTGVTGL